MTRDSSDLTLESACRDVGQLSRSDTREGTAVSSLALTGGLDARLGSISTLDPEHLGGAFAQRIIRKRGGANLVVRMRRQQRDAPRSTASGSDAETDGVAYPGLESSYSPSESTEDEFLAPGRDDDSDSEPGSLELARGLTDRSASDASRQLTPSAIGERHAGDFGTERRPRAQSDTDTEKEGGSTSIGSADSLAAPSEIEGREAYDTAGRARPGTIMAVNPDRQSESERSRPHSSSERTQRVSRMVTRQFERVRDRAAVTETVLVGDRTATGQRTSMDDAGRNSSRSVLERDQDGSADGPRVQPSDGVGTVSDRGHSTRRGTERTESVVSTPGSKSTRRVDGSSTDTGTPDTVAGDAAPRPGTVDSTTSGTDAVGSREAGSNSTADRSTGPGERGKQRASTDSQREFGADTAATDAGTERSVVERTTTEVPPVEGSPDGRSSTETGGRAVSRPTATSHRDGSARDGPQFVSGCLRVTAGIVPGPDVERTPDTTPSRVVSGQQTDAGGSERPRTTVAPRRSHTEQAPPADSARSSSSSDPVVAAGTQDLAIPSVSVLDTTPEDGERKRASEVGDALDSQSTAGEERPPEASAHAGTESVTLPRASRRQQLVDPSEQQGQERGGSRSAETTTLDRHAELGNTEPVQARRDRARTGGVASNPTGASRSDRTARGEPVSAVDTKSGAATDDDVETERGLQRRSELERSDRSLQRESTPSKAGGDSDSTADQQPASVATDRLPRTTASRRQDAETIGELTVHRPPVGRSPVVPRTNRPAPATDGERTTGVRDKGGVESVSDAGPSVAGLSDRSVERERSDSSRPPSRPGRSASADSGPLADSASNEAGPRVTQSRSSGDSVGMGSGAGRASEPAAVTRDVRRAVRESNRSTPGGQTPDSVPAAEAKQAVPPRAEPERNRRVRKETAIDADQAPLRAATASRSVETDRTESPSADPVTGAAEHAVSTARAPESSLGEADATVRRRQQSGERKQSDESLPGRSMRRQSSRLADVGEQSAVPGAMVRERDVSASRQSAITERRTLDGGASVPAGIQSFTRSARSEGDRPGVRRTVIPGRGRDPSPAVQHREVGNQETAERANDAETGVTGSPAGTAGAELTPRRSPAFERSADSSRPSLAPDQGASSTGSSAPESSLRGSWTMTERPSIGERAIQRARGGDSHLRHTGSSIGDVLGDGLSDGRQRRERDERRADVTAAVDDARGRRTHLDAGEEPVSHGTDPVSGGRERRADDSRVTLSSADSSVSELLDEPAPARSSASSGEGRRSTAVGPDGATGRRPTRASRGSSRHGEGQFAFSDSLGARRGQRSGVVDGPRSPVLGGRSGSTNRRHPDDAEGGQKRPIEDSVGRASTNGRYTARSPGDLSVGDVQRIDRQRPGPVGLGHAVVQRHRTQTISERPVVGVSVAHRSLGVRSDASGGASNTMNAAAKAVRQFGPLRANDDGSGTVRANDDGSMLPQASPSAVSGVDVGRGRLGSSEGVQRVSSPARTSSVDPSTLSSRSSARRVVERASRFADVIGVGDVGGEPPESDSLEVGEATQAESRMEGLSAESESVSGGAVRSGQSAGGDAAPGQKSLGGRFKYNNKKTEYNSPQGSASGTSSGIDRTNAPNADTQPSLVYRRDTPPEPTNSAGRQRRDAATAGAGTEQPRTQTSPGHRTRPSQAQSPSRDGNAARNATAGASQHRPGAADREMQRQSAPAPHDDPFEDSGSDFGETQHDEMRSHTTSQANQDAGSQGQQARRGQGRIDDVDVQLGDQSMQLNADVDRLVDVLYRKLERKRRIERQRRGF